ncbi:hypothetical protein K443DRAFT_630675, partial [Laccaria amethystina LaAM-08-1]
LLQDTGCSTGRFLPSKNVTLDSRSSTVLTRHRKFYFLDGSVIIIIDVSAFKVHQSVLSRHSDVFAGMWGVSQPRGIPDIDGCPTAELQDNVSDFTDTLKSLTVPIQRPCLYPILTYFDNLPPNADLTTLLTFLSGITTKCNMQQLRNKCIALLCQKFPSTLSGCAVIAQQYQYTPSTTVRLIPLARETNIPEVLPWAYYICTQMSIPDLLINPILSWQDKAAGKLLLA